VPHLTEGPAHTRAFLLNLKPGSQFGLNE